MSRLVARDSRMPLSRLKHLLGGNPSLMALPIGSKAPKAGSTYDSSVTGDKQTLSESNIAVRLGADYGNVCAIDFDGIETFTKSGAFKVNPDDLLEQFFKLNPSLKWSLRTKGRRGASVWVKVDGVFDSKVKNLCMPAMNESVGELRFDKYSLIQGIHPDTGNPYKVVVDAPAINVSLGEITWLDGRTMDKVLGSSVKAPSLLHRNTHDVYTSYKGSMDELQSIVSAYIPKGPHQSSNIQFHMARHIKTWEREQSVKLSDEQLFEIGIRWHKSTPGKYLRNQGPDRYAVEFIERYNAVKTCIGDGGETFDQALKSAHEDDCHDKVARFFPLSKDVQLAANLCRALAKASGKAAFFLSARKLQEALELPHAMAGHRILRALQTIRAIKEVNKGSMKRRRASYYRYLLDDIHVKEQVA